MFSLKLVRLVFSSLLACLASVALASPPADSNANRPEGTWLLDVNFPAQFNNPPLSFKELITFHAGGTLTETNSTLNAASGVLGFSAGGFGLVGSDGQGTWRRTERGQIEVVFRKMVFCGTAIGLCSTIPPSGKAAGELVGYLVVRLTATIKGDSLVVPLGGDTRLVIGPTPDDAIPFGKAAATGVRLH